MMTVQLTQEIDIKETLHVLHSGSRDARLDAVAELAMADDDRALLALIEAVYDHSAGVRVAAGLALIASGDEAGITGLVGALHDGSWSVRDTITQVIEEALRSEADIRLQAELDDALIDALVTGVPETRRAASMLLGLTGSEAAIRPLAVALHDADAEVRLAAARSLGQLVVENSEVAVPALVEALRDSCRDVRRAAAQSLGEIGNAAAIPALIGMLWDADWSMQQVATAALDRIGSPGLAAVTAWRESDPGR